MFRILKIRGATGTWEIYWGLWQSRTRLATLPLEYPVLFNLGWESLEQKKIKQNTRKDEKTFKIRVKYTLIVGVHATLFIKGEHIQKNFWEIVCVWLIRTADNLVVNSGIKRTHLDLKRLIVRRRRVFCGSQEHIPHRISGSCHILFGTIWWCCRIVWGHIYSRVDITGGQPDLKEGGSLIKLVGESYDLIKSKLLWRIEHQNPLSRKSILHNKKENDKMDLFTFVIGNWTRQCNFRLLRKEGDLDGK